VIDPVTRHDTDDPFGWLNALEAACLAESKDLCQHCRPTCTEVVPMGGNGWAVDVTHEPGCPLIAEDT